MMNLVNFSALAVLVLSVAACSKEDNANDYSLDIMNNFVNSCSAQGNLTKSQCQCILRGIQQEYTQEEYVAIEVGMMSGNAAPEKFTKVAASAMTSCAK